MRFDRTDNKILQIFIYFDRSHNDDNFMRTDF